MKISFNKDNKLEFDLCDLLDSVSAESKVELIESLACDESILKHVVDQILDALTENAYCGASDYPERSTPYYSLSFARREISKRSGEVAKTVIERLEKSLAAAEKRIKDLEELQRNSWYEKRDRY